MTEESMEEKKIKGRKRHIATDTQGHLLYVKVHAANIHDTSMGGKILEETLKKYPSVQGACFDAGYRGTTVEYVTNVLKKVANISSKITDKWAVLPVRWIVERTLSWLNGSRRLAKDFEISTQSEQAFVMIAHSSTILKKLV